MSGRVLVVVGDTLLDRDVEGRVERLCPDAPVPVVDEVRRTSRPGGAGLAAALAAGDGHEVVLISALALDPPGRELVALLDEAGVEVVDLGLEGATPEKVRILTDGRSLLRVDRGGCGGPGTVGAPTNAVLQALATARAVLVADYGRGVAAQPGLRDAFSDAATRAPVVWDPHPRGPEPVRGARLATPNRSEAAGLVSEVSGDGASAAAERALALSARWEAEIAVTLGAGGALLADRNGSVLNVPAPEVAGGDPCGAGDRFASRAAGLLAGGASTAEAVTGAVRAASGFVAAGGAAGMSFRREEPAGEAESVERVIGRVRATGGTVVATGGCFDLLHAGHVRTLEAARALGDCLIVCLNSDSSVRRIKGSDRPLVPEEDRADVLEALSCVDAVVVFDEDTPENVLERLRPDVFAKGADYAVSELPEARLLARWGGRAVILPYVAGRSTSRLIQEAVSRSVVEKRG